MQHVILLISQSLMLSFWNWHLPQKSWGLCFLCKESLLCCQLSQQPQVSMSGQHPQVSMSSGQVEVSIRQVVNSAFSDSYTNKMKCSINKAASDIDGAKHAILDLQTRLNMEKCYDYEAFIAAVCKVKQSLAIDDDMQWFSILLHSDKPHSSGCEVYFTSIKNDQLENDVWLQPSEVPETHWHWQ